VRVVIALAIFTSMACNDRSQEERLFQILYKNTFVPNDNVTIEFVDSTSFVVLSDADTLSRLERGLWSVENRLSGTYLILDSSEMRLEILSDSVVTFKRGAFNPRFVRLKK